MNTPIGVETARDQVDAILFELEQEGARNRRRARRIRNALTVIDPPGEWKEEDE